MIFIYLFISFFKIGLFGFGGGYAILSLIQNDLVFKHHWITSGEFIDMVAISQMTPGPIGINAATYVGYTAVLNAGYSPAWSVLGSITATVATVLPSFILMILISKFFLKYQKHPVVAQVFKGLRPAVVGLLAAAALGLMTRENFSSWEEDTHTFCISVALFAITLIATRFYKVNAILMIVLCGVAGFFIYG